MKHISQMEIHRISWFILMPLLVYISSATCAMLRFWQRPDGLRKSSCTGRTSHCFDFSQKPTCHERETKYQKARYVSSGKKKHQAKVVFLFFLQKNNPTLTITSNVLFGSKLGNLHNKHLQPSRPQAIDRNTNFGGNQHVVIHLGWQGHGTRGSLNFHIIAS